MKIYHYYFDTKEFYKEENYKPVKGLGLPAHSTIKKPLDPKEGYAVVFDEREQEWVYVEDHRGKTVWTYDKQKIVIDTPGALQNVTIEEPGEFDIWTGDGWKEDEAYKRVVQRDKKIHELYKLFSVLSSLIDAEVANREEKRKFKELKKFFALLEKHEHLGGEFPKFPDLENKSIIKAIINIFK